MTLDGRKPAHSALALRIGRLGSMSTMAISRQLTVCSNQTKNQHAADGVLGRETGPLVTDAGWSRSIEGQE